MAITKWSIFRAQDGEANSVPANDDSSATWIYSLQVNHGGRAKYARPLAALNEHIEEPGDEVFRHACRLGYEGVVSKRLDST
jgi:hypothetical protein